MIFKIVDQTPAIRSGQGFRMFGNNIFNDGGFSRAFDTGNKDVVSGAFHIQSEFDGLDRPLLTDDFIQGFDFRGIFELKNFRVADTS